jgi:hypothetical protein
MNVGHELKARGVSTAHSLFDPSRSFIGILLILALGSAIVVVRWPLAAVIGIVGVLLVWSVWPTWLRYDIDYYAAIVLTTAVLSVLPRQVQVGPVTLGGFLTSLEVVLAMLLLIREPGRLGAAWRSMWPLIAFLIWSWLSLLRGETTVDGLQNGVVFTGFIVVATVAYVRTVDDARFAYRLQTLFERVSGCSSCSASAASSAMGRVADSVPQHGHRSFALRFR